MQKLLLQAIWRTKTWQRSWIERKSERETLRKIVRDDHVENALVMPPLRQRPRGPCQSRWQLHRPLRQRRDMPHDQKIVLA